MEDNTNINNQVKKALLDYNISQTYNYIENKYYLNILIQNLNSTKNELTNKFIELIKYRNVINKNLLSAFVYVYFISLAKYETNKFNSIYRSIYNDDILNFEQQYRLLKNVIDKEGLDIDNQLSQLNNNLNKAIDVSVENIFGQSSKIDYFLIDTDGDVDTRPESHIAIKPTSFEKFSFKKSYYGKWYKLKPSITGSYDNVYTDIFVYTYSKTSNNNLIYVSIPRYNIINRPFSSYNNENHKYECKYSDQKTPIYIQFKDSNGNNEEFNSNDGIFQDVEVIEYSSNNVVYTSDTNEKKLIEAYEQNFFKLSSNHKSSDTLINVEYNISDFSKGSSIKSYIKYQLSGTLDALYNLKDYSYIYNGILNVKTIANKGLDTYVINDSIPVELYLYNTSQTIFFNYLTINFRDQSAKKVTLSEWLLVLTGLFHYYKQSYSKDMTFNLATLSKDLFILPGQDQLADIMFSMFNITDKYAKNKETFQKEDNYNQILLAFKNFKISQEELFDEFYNKLINLDDIINSLNYISNEMSKSFGNTEYNILKELNEYLDEYRTNIKAMDSKEIDLKDKIHNKLNYFNNLFEYISTNLYDFYNQGFKSKHLLDSLIQECNSFIDNSINSDIELNELFSKLSDFSKLDHNSKNLFQGFAFYPFKLIKTNFSDWHASINKYFYSSYSLSLMLYMLCSFKQEQYLLYTEDNLKNVLIKELFYIINTLIFKEKIISDLYLTEEYKNYKNQYDLFISAGYDISDDINLIKTEPLNPNLYSNELCSTFNDFCNYDLDFIMRNTTFSGSINYNKSYLGNLIYKLILKTDIRYIDELCQEVKNITTYNNIKTDLFYRYFYSSLNTVKLFNPVDDSEEEKNKEDLYRNQIESWLNILTGDKYSMSNTSTDNLITIEQYQKIYMSLFKSFDLDKIFNDKKILSLLKMEALEND